MVTWSGVEETETNFLLLKLSKSKSAENFSHVWGLGPRDSGSDVLSSVSLPDLPYLIKGIQGNHMFYGCLWHSKELNSL